MVELALQIVWIAFCAVVGIQVVYYCAVVVRLFFHKSSELRDIEYPVSVVVAARNEEDNLQKLLPALLEQRGVEFEVIVADDCSLDDTYLVLRDFADKDSRIRYTQIHESANFSGGKKFALTMAIKAARYEHIVCIDADCIPSSKTWLQRMAQELHRRPIVIGYAPLNKTSGLLNKLIRFDVFQIGMQYLGLAKTGIPYMGVGRNMAYRSQIFFDQKGFSSHYDIKSGDDDLLVNAAATSKNTAVVFHPYAFVYSDAKYTWSQWIMQKSRHLTTAPRYRFSHLLTLGILSFSQYAVFGLFVVLLLANMRVQETLILMGFRYVVQQAVQIGNLTKTKELDLIPISLFLEPFYLMFYPALVVRNTIIRTNAWKR